MLINLRQSYIRAAGERKILNDLLMMAFASFIPVFRGLIFLKDDELPRNKKGVLDKIQEIFGADMKPFKRILDAKISGASLKTDDSKEIFNLCYNGLGKLVELVDAFEI